MHCGTCCFSDIFFPFLVSDDTAQAKTLQIKTLSKEKNITLFLFWNGVIMFSLASISSIEKNKRGKIQTTQKLPKKPIILKILLTLMNHESFSVHTTTLNLQEPLS